MTSPLVDRSLPPPGESSAAACAAILERARRELPEAAFNLWFVDLRPGELKGDVFELITPSAYVKNWLTGHHMELITSSVRGVLGPKATVRLKMDRSKRAREATGDSSDRSPSRGR